MTACSCVWPAIEQCSHPGVIRSVQLLQAHKFASAFWHLKAARTLELSSDTDLATDSKDAFQVHRIMQIRHALHYPLLSSRYKNRLLSGLQESGAPDETGISSDHR